VFKKLCSFKDVFTVWADIPNFLKHSKQMHVIILEILFFPTPWANLLLKLIFALFANVKPTRKAGEVTLPLLLI